MKVNAPLERMPVNLDFESPAEAKGFKAVINLDSKVVDFASGITGKINFKNLGVQCLAIYGCLLRKEEITATSSPLSKRKWPSLVTSYQNIQLTYGEPALREYPFYYSLPKNYSCETSSGKKGPFMVSFMFSLRIILKSGHILTKSVPLTLYRLAPEKPREEEAIEDD